MTRRLRGLVLIGCVLAMPAAPQAGGVAHPRDAADVFVMATLAGDADAIAALYAPNAIFLAPDTPMITGRDAIRGVFERHFLAGRSSIRFFDVKIDSAGDRALVVWRWISEVALDGGAPVRTDGRSMVYMVKGDAGWQISADMLQVMPPKS